MASSSPSIGVYAETWLDLLNPVPGRRVHVVIGNMSGDLDSTVSAIATAYTFQYCVGNTICETIESQYPAQEHVFVPIMRGSNRPWKAGKKTSLDLRKEMGVMCDILGICSTQLLFSEDEPTLSLLQTLSEAGNLGLVLTDHNFDDRAVPNEKNGGGGGGVEIQGIGVVECILDHHVDQGKHSHVFGDLRRISPGVGSTCTLIGQEIVQMCPGFEPDIAVLYALHRVVLIDTNICHPDPERHIGTKLDIEMEHMLHLVIRRHEWKSIVAARNDKTGWDTGDHLGADIKAFCVGPVRVGLASITVSIDDFLLAGDGSVASGIDDIQAFACHKEYDLVVSMHAFVEEGVFNRQVLFYTNPASVETGRSPSAEDIVHDAKTSMPSLVAHLSAHTFVDTKYLVAREQTDLGMKRKCFTEPLKALISTTQSK